MVMDVPAPGCIHELFEATAARCPERIAVTAEHGQLTYRELNRLSNQVARRLQRLGVGPEVVVGICMDRSVEMIVGLLGILKAGGAYLPLDPTYPDERLTFMLHNAKTSVLVTHARVVPRFSGETLPLLCLEPTPMAEDIEETQTNVDSGVAPHNLAYVMYTSGSTGTPKGVMIEHASLVHYVRTALQTFGIVADDRILQFCSLSFDISVEEIFPALTQGATVVLRSESMSASASIFLQKCHEWAVTVVSLPTAYWHELVDRLSVEPMNLPPSLRLVIIGGERVLADKVKRWTELVGRRVHLLNTYGVTEATVLQVMCELTGFTGSEGDSRGVPIGRVVPGVTAHVLDSDFSAVDIGAAGELYVGGRQLARGYVNLPHITAERFLPNPFEEGPGSRLYKTGDLVRRLPGDQMEYLGRVDHQVKIRGFRVECGEIESVLIEHASVGDAVVLSHDQDGGHSRLVAYLVAHRGQAVTSAELTAFCKKKLPDYMVPSIFVTLPRMPLSANGKVDRTALVALGSAPSRHDTAPALPLSATERLIAEIWSQALGTDCVSATDNFFELGGHSLLLVHVIGTMEDKLGVRLSKEDFILQTLGQIATTCEEQRACVPTAAPTLLQRLHRVTRSGATWIAKCRALVASGGDSLKDRR